MKNHKIMIIFQGDFYMTSYVDRLNKFLNDLRVLSIVDMVTGITLYTRKGVIR